MKKNYKGIGINTSKNTHETVLTFVEENDRHASILDIPCGGGTLRACAKIKYTKSDASGGKVSHLESGLSQRFNPRSSDQITAAFFLNLCIYFLPEP